MEVLSDRAQVVVTPDQVLARTRAGISHLSSRLRFGETLKAPQTRWAMTNIREYGVVVKEPGCTSGYHLHPGHAEWTQESWMRDCQVLKRYRACCAGGTFRAVSGRSTTGPAVRWWRPGTRVGVRLKRQNAKVEMRSNTMVAESPNCALPPHCNADKKLCLHWKGESKKM